MLAEKASKKAPKEVKNENKKPPVKVVEQKESSKSQKTVKDLVKEEKSSKNTQASKTSTTSKNIKKDKNDKNDEIEKKMLKGQDHIEPKEELKEKEKEKEKKETIEVKYEPPQPKINELEERKQTIVKPRETYLKEKLAKMNYNPNLMTNIQKEMGNKIKNIMTQEGVVVSEKTKDLKKCMETKDRTRTEIEEYSNKKSIKK